MLDTEDRYQKKTLEDYVYAERIGRSGTRINRDKRKYFFDVYERYLEIRERYDYNI